MQTLAEVHAESTHSFGLNQDFLHAYCVLGHLLPHCFSHVRHSPGSITAPTNNPKKINDPNEETKYLVVSPFDFISLTSQIEQNFLGGQLQTEN